jgi:DeoR/GlpR family transcriptional regulator of sugar metabolism
VIDHTKFGAYGTYRLSDLAAYDFVATDAPPPDGLDEHIKFIY